jgi:hypothetical protein
MAGLSLNPQRSENYFSADASLSANGKKTIPEMRFSQTWAFGELLIHAASEPATIATEPKTTSATRTINAPSW